MRELKEYPVLCDEVFYRGMHILDYLYTAKDISSLDIEAIKNTILSALVEKKEINPGKEFLNLRGMAMTSTYFFGCNIYDSKPFIQGFPLWIKEKLRKRSLNITGSLPVSVYLARLTSDSDYDIQAANVALSIIFEDFEFIFADYNSMSNPKTRVLDRQFLVAKVDGIDYIFDVLTKRMYDKKEFARVYEMEIKESVRKSEFNEQQKQLYANQTAEETDNYAEFLAMTCPFIEAMSDVPNMQEYIHEIELSKVNFPDAFENAKHFSQAKKDPKELKIGALTV